MKMNQSLITLMLAMLLLLTFSSTEAATSIPAKIAIVKLRCSTEPNLQAFQNYLSNSPYVSVVQFDSKNYINHTSLTEEEIRSWTNSDILVLVKMTDQKIEIRAFRTDTAEFIIGKQYEGGIGTGELVFEMFSKNLIDYAKVSERSIEIKSVGKEPPSQPDIGLDNELTDIPKYLHAAITNSALVKIILLDLQFNIVGINWKDRDSRGVGESVLINNLKLLFSKYSISKEKILKGIGVSIDSTILNGAMQGQWKGDEERAYAIISLPDSWQEVLHLNDCGSLPETKFKSGRIILSIRKGYVSVNFDNGTRCQIKGVDYVYSDFRWRRIN